MKKLVEIASEIVRVLVSLRPMSPADIALLLQQVFRTLQVMQQSELAGILLVPNQAVEEMANQSEEKSALTPENSIQNDKVICLECGMEMRQLTHKHLSSHDLNTNEYKKKYGFSMKTPLSA